MNKPDENTLNRWLLGELEGEELRKVEAWADENVGELDSEFKCNIGWEALGADFMKAVPASEEPPYPEFFNHKLQQTIEAGDVEQNTVPAQAEPGIWQKLRWMVMPTAIAAGIAFYAGSHLTSGSVAPGGDQGGIVSYERVYVPNSNVVAAFSETDRATEIILEGLTPISDELDIVKGETSLGDPPSMMVIHPSPQNPQTDPSDNQVTFF